jgi:hypothetical protein
MNHQPAYSFMQIETIAKSALVILDARFNIAPGPGYFKGKPILLSA